MTSFNFQMNSSVGYDCFDAFEYFPISFRGKDGDLHGGSELSQSLVWESEKGQLVKAAPAVAVVEKERSEGKALAALKSHSESERRRRERINANLATLRGLVPCPEKIDKATLLGQVISEVKELKKNAAQASKDLVIPLDADEVKVEPCNDGARDGHLSFKASLCCIYKPQLLVDLRKALDALPMDIVKAEISTLGDRLKYTFIFSSCRTAGSIPEAESTQLLVRSVHQALYSVLDKTSASVEYSLRTTSQSKRRRISYLDSSSSSS